MFRFSVNRSWAFILALCLFTTCLFTVQLPSAASAAGAKICVSLDDPWPSQSLGDPDVPTGPGDGKVGGLSGVRTKSNQVVLQGGARPVVGRAALASVVMDRVQLFLLSLRSFYLHS
jgi:hypothetical protein